VATALLMPAAPAGAEAVWDPKEIARLAEEAAAAAEQLSHVVELLGSINDLGRTVGRFGDLAQLDFMHFDTTKALAGASPELSALAEAVPEVAGMRFDSWAESEANVRTILSLPAGRSASASERIALGQRLRAVRETAGEVSYAMALSARDGTALGGARTELLAAQAEAQVDARGDVGANTAASLAVFEQLVQTRALLAAIAELDALAELTDHGPPPGTATEAP
jgi:hypothetical protein